MAIYGIADLHLDSAGDKPMDIFGHNWINHQEKIFSNWQNIIGEEDLVLVAGDISWALKLSEAYIDLKKIDELPGKKIFIRGNHDYWWGTKAKLKELGLKTIDFIHNDSFLYQSIAICGTRGWASHDSGEFDPHDEKIFERELRRLEASISSVRDNTLEKIVMLHYPPFNFENKAPNEFVELMLKYNISKCVYGHLHGEGHKFAVEGYIEGIEFHCISCDFIDFMPKKIWGNLR
ncbi:hypothetical protein SAMN05660462_01373 [Proteiniborus ethanoligenes]|uniref:Calcineurin-like phosphoesterase domain-containing protein n=1 Tax=Proteiniborus ethanoligenes TaxID=415015 RepID=A0A1H3P796_9FIRM|nr:metallophosphoesterase [Proteiniborus ethanoligenes]TAH63193.1 MAG: serine/threonine protein phosphatase [Gottschalkiaceae bacterium]SDY96685.1 hypothetical protein SAMN05660462_01373 [Proteiniborus ethanoligenes]